MAKKQKEQVFLSDKSITHIAEIQLLHEVSHPRLKRLTISEVVDMIVEDAAKRQWKKDSNLSNAQLKIEGQ